MLERPCLFGAELRRLRIAAGLTLTQFATTVHYSKGQISKVETGRKRPSTEFARLCDAALEAGGALAALVPAVPGRRPSAQPPIPDQAGAMRTDSTNHPDDGQWSPPTRRQLMAAGAVSVFGVAASAPTTSAATTESESSGQPLVDAYRGLFDQYRRIGQLSPPQALLPTLVEQTGALRSLAVHTGGDAGRGLLALAARFAEFTGWMAQEAGDDAAAARWTVHAVDIAEAAGDQHLASYALVRQALITYYRGEGADTVALAEGALSGRLPPRIRALAAQRAAQGHALDGDHDACMRLLERARVLFDRAAAEGPASDAPVLGPTHLRDPVAMVTGWCLLDLGRPREAAELLDAQYARLAPDALRTRCRYGARRALAHAVAGEIAHACELTGDLLEHTSGVGSQTITADLRRLARVLSRHPRHPACRALAPSLTAALSPQAL
ncbi:helix-turn-helix transcriptional regulator [Streptomyces gilvifuscus]|uniref:Helix-turn-helix transcriptional regulator n=1 Tax=Streptomyces gilvifuscus TaxID=1550617 RepID=A0ABT5FUG0_9ACTN|nr:helix-turn-helix transcriptional regulator [Streptomyces gilvifuscus]MDC2956128.1 helix-turn-helix transcriptional regulator [Streptomyces gilvifuscus]